jgi:hypothetical protein
MAFEMSPLALRRAAADLTDLTELPDQVRAEPTGAYHAVAPDRFANSDWAATAANDCAVAAADAALAALAGRCRSLADVLSTAALAYECADEAAAERLPCAPSRRAA